MNNMTALVSCFARAYHFENNDEHIFADPAARKLLGDDYNAISDNMTSGISFFAPEFKGEKSDALRLIAEQHLAPPVLARSAFCESTLNNAICLGCRQYIVFGAGYDTFAFRNTDPHLKILELDRAEIITDKIRRAKLANLATVGEHRYIPCDLAKIDLKAALAENGFDSRKTAFGSLLGLNYYISKEDFSHLLAKTGEIWANGSSLIFDYPTPLHDAKSQKTKQLAAAANEQMKSEYSYNEIEKLLQNCGFLIYEHLDFEQATTRFFAKYNLAHPTSPMLAPKGTSYCLAVKKT
ncbi:MAG: class I SAM-dependent methyltransferase [Oscillospiraceae bacterium]|nr:class I SAM-dependent methyltransferase [Oscillospiraceae bacterium]